MMALDIVGVLAQCETFDRPLSLENLEPFKIPELNRPYFEDLLAEAKRAGRADLVKVAKWCLGSRNTIPGRVRRELKRFYRKIAGAGKKVLN